MSDNTIIRIAPYEYIHVLDNNHNTTRVIIGPLTFTIQDHEKVIRKPTKMIVVPPRHYAIIKDPAIRPPSTEKGVIPEPVRDKFGQVQLRHGDKEIRFHEEWPEPFPLMPGEELEKNTVHKMEVIYPDSALRLTAKRDFYDEETKKSYHAGDEWLFEGPGTYHPRIEVDVLEKFQAKIILANQSLKLRARNQCMDRQGIHRKAGEEWLVRKPGSYLHGVDEIIIGTVNAIVLTPITAIHLLATQSFVDIYGVQRKAGEEWLVTYANGESHIPDVFEEVVRSKVEMYVLSQQQHCVILDPVDYTTGRNKFGCKELRVGPSNFFLLPGESLEDGKIKLTPVLGEGEALLLKAKESFFDTKNNLQRTPGDRWMILGPCEYVPSVNEDIIEVRKNIPLDENEGIYVRNIKTGRVSDIVGPCTYMLKSYEELWEKELPTDIEELLEWSYLSGTDIKREKSVKGRDKTRVVTYRVPHNSAVQIYDYQQKKSRVVFGPHLVMLKPDEQFTLLSLSGSKPKRPNVIKTVALLLGPDFMTDIIEVESADHARLRLQVSYNWKFDLDENKEDANKIFQVRDFVGDACKALASIVRGTVATKTFDEFHRTSARLIRAAVFGYDEEKDKVGENYIFHENKLLITNIDIQSVESVDQRTKESLQRSVQQAIEITTKKQEAKARHEAASLEQVAKGLIERQKILNATGSEEQMKFLMELRAETNAIESTGAKKAEAKAAAQALAIEGQSEVEIAKLLSEASELESKAEIDDVKRTQDAEISFQDALAKIEIEKNQILAGIESNKFKAIVDSISPQTIKAIAQAGPDLRARLLKSLGLKGYLVTDGNSPINLFRQANGMIGM